MTLECHSNGQTPRAGRLMAVLAILSWLSGTAGTLAQEIAAEHLACGLEAGPARAVAHVVDGDTVRLDDGKALKLAGILAPRAVDAGAARGTWPPEEAAQEALRSLAAGQTVALAFTGARSDRYERVVAHLFVSRDGNQTWVQRELVARGHARVHFAPGAGACLGPLVAEEAKARAAGLGLWANAAYQVRPADRPTELQRYAGTYQLIAGTVARVTGSHAIATLELASSEPPPIEGSGKRAVKTRIFWKRSPALQGVLDARRLDGAPVLVRGWIENRGQPEIEVLAPEQIEVQGAASGTGAGEDQPARQGRARTGQQRPGTDAAPGGRQ